MMQVQGSSFEKPLVIHPVHSLSLKLVVVLPHLLAILFVFILIDINVVVAITLAMMIILSFIYYYRWHVSKSLNKSVISVVHLFQQNKQTVVGNKKLRSEQGGWKISLSGQKDITVNLLSSSFVSTGWIVLNFKDQKRNRYTLMLPFDAITSEQHRQLRVRIEVS